MRKSCNVFCLISLILKKELHVIQNLIFCIYNIDKPVTGHGKNRTKKLQHGVEPRRKKVYLPKNFRLHKKQTSYSMCIPSDNIFTY